MIPDSHFDRFDTKKYRSRNPVQRALIRRFVRRLSQLFSKSGLVRSVLEVGCGEGFLCGYMSERYPEVEFTGVDICETDIAALQSKFPRVDAHVCSAYDLSSLTEGAFDVVICAEVLEHLDNPDLALKQFLSLQPRSIILTVPHEPWFMLSNLLRGKDIARLGNNPEHINHFGKRSFRRWLAAHLEVPQVTTSFPWLLAQCCPKDILPKQSR